MTTLLAEKKIPQEIEFRYSCLCAPKPELALIMVFAKEITCETFRRRVGKKNYEELETLLGYTKELRRKCRLFLQSDPEVRFFRSRLYDGRKVYICEHSRIEYVFY